MKYAQNALLIVKDFRLKNKWTKGGLTAVVYALLCIFGFVFIYPLIFIVLRSFMPADDILNPAIDLVPSAFTLENFKVIAGRMNILYSLGYSTMLSGVSSVLQAISCGLMGYALSRYDFKLKKLFLALVLVCFIVPAQVLMIPTFIGFNALNIVGSPLSFFIPAALGQGFKSPIFILIFYSFFNTIPKDLDEAGQIDGASPLQIFTKVIIPLAIPALVLVFIFSMVWYWNESYLTAIYIGNSAKTLVNQVYSVLTSLDGDVAYNPFSARVNVPIRMAAALLTIAPILLFYLVLQRQFVEGIDKSGITGE